MHNLRMIMHIVYVINAKFLTDYSDFLWFFLNSTLNLQNILLYEIRGQKKKTFKQLQTQMQIFLLYQMPSNIHPK